VGGTLDGRDEGADVETSNYSLNQTPVTSYVDFDVKDKGHVHLRWNGQWAGGNRIDILDGTYVSPATGTAYCVGRGTVVLSGGSDNPYQSGGQFELDDLKVGDCSSGKSVDGTIYGCFDDG
jgi:hypothetical protein